MNKAAALVASEFPNFFQELWGYDPFPWQKRLARRVCEGDWPECIALPTAAGKTACIDIAVFALACQADSGEKRTASRRIFFVVDRRIVVDQAYDRADKLAKLLTKANTGILRRVADSLRQLAHDDRPLDCYALRGGMYRESAWVRSPLQPTVITSTVDQVGSRLLFRGYGVSDSLKPVHAGLIGNDSLILLDEAHCARPFDQTVTLVEKYRTWTRKAPSPFRFVSITATPAGDIQDEHIERDRHDDHAHPVLGARIQANKRTKLVIAEKARGKNWRPQLVKELARHATTLIDDGLRAVGVIVNRVATARETAAALRNQSGLDVDVVLLTGRMRPLDRDALVSKLDPLLSGNSGELRKPVIVVATQCLEVGADLDFHALVTECASLDALRQRFGRLNRTAARPRAKAVVIIRQDQIKPVEKQLDRDPVYGNSLASTWKWLEDTAENGVFDFGVAAVNKRTAGLDSDRLAALNAPTDDAAVLLPAHLDYLVQTSPVPVPNPDPAVFLHGPSRGAPDVQVVFRADLGDDPRSWAEIVSLCPPSSSEALPVRLNVFRRWLGGVSRPDDTSDVEGERAADDDKSKSTGDRCALRWSGPDSDRTTVVTALAELSPGDLYVLPVTGPDVSDLGDFPAMPPTDYGDEAFQRSRDRAILRLTPTIRDIPTLAHLTMDDEAFDERLSDAIRSLLENEPPGWLSTAGKHLSKPKLRTIRPHPLGGFVVVGRNRLRQHDPTFIEADLPEPSQARPMTLTDHGGKVAALARLFADECGLKTEDCDVFELAGQLHDIGKADPRFQAWLHGGNRRKAEAASDLLAKSVGLPGSARDYRATRQKSGYPEGGRHELLSVRLMESDGTLRADHDRCDLALHLIASHHGKCRPFAPVVDDPDPEYVVFRHNGRDLCASTATGLERLDSGVAERFWTLTRRYGWWGLAYLEAILRLADWKASADAATKEHKR